MVAHKLGLIRIRDIVIKNAGVIARLRFVATVLASGALQDGNKLFAVRR